MQPWQGIIVYIISATETMQGETENIYEPEEADYLQYTW